MNQITRLTTLQATDSDILAKKKLLTDVLAALKEPEALQTARTAAEKAQAVFTKLNTQQTDLELQLGSVQAKRKSSSDHMYSGKVTGARELSDLQAEADSLGRRADGLEMQVLDVMEKKEAAETIKNAAEAELTQLESDWNQKSSDLETEKKSLATALAKLLNVRKIQAEKVDATMLARYDKIRRKSKGIAVVKIKLPNRCGGCLLTLSATDVKTVGEGKLIYCSQCGRIIVSQL